jgi:hypothetical protein
MIWLRAATRPTTYQITFGAVSGNKIQTAQTVCEGSILPPAHLADAITELFPGSCLLTFPLIELVMP